METVLTVLICRNAFVDKGAFAEYISAITWICLKCDTTGVQTPTSSATNMKCEIGHSKYLLRGPQHWLSFLGLEYLALVVLNKVYCWASW